jgi:hypothetical protein
MSRVPSPYGLGYLVPRLRRSCAKSPLIWDPPASTGKLELAPRSWRLPIIAPRGFNIPLRNATAHCATAYRSAVGATQRSPARERWGMPDGNRISAVGAAQTSGGETTANGLLFPAPIAHALSYPDHKKVEMEFPPSRRMNLV